MAVIYKTNAGDAQQMVQQWYAMAGVQNPSPAAIAHWTKEIQQDGSHTAFLTFSNGQGQDTQSAFNPQTLIQNVKQFTTQQGYAPWQPNAQTQQLAGTNTKSGGAIIGSALNSPVGKVIEGVVAGAIDVATGGAATPFTTAGLAALQGGGTAMEPGNNLGTALKAGLGGAAEGAMAGAGAGAFTGLTRIGAASTSLPGMDLSGLSPEQMSSIGDASSGAGGAAASGVDMTGGAAGSALSGAANAGSGGSMGGALGSLLGGNNNSSTNGSGGFNFGSLLSGLGGAANAYTNYQSTQQAAEAREAQLAEQEAEFNRTQGDTEGMDAASLQRTVNNAPLRDKAQAIMMARLGAPPTPFAPRDITHGNTGVLSGNATGGIAPTMNAVNQAAQNYTPGSGGVNTSVDQTLINRFMNPQQTTTKIPGGYTLPSGPTYTGSNAYTPPSTPSAPAAPPMTPPTSTTPLTPISQAPAQPTAGANVAATGGSTNTSGNPQEDELNQLLQQRLGAAA